MEVVRTRYAGISLHSASCKLVAALSSEAPCLSPLISSHCEGGSQSGGTPPLSQLPPRGTDAIFLKKTFIFTQLHGNLSCVLVVINSSASIQWVFCENCSTCNFDLFLGSGELHIHPPPWSPLTHLNITRLLIWHHVKCSHERHQCSHNGQLRDLGLCSVFPLLTPLLFAIPSSVDVHITASWFPISWPLSVLVHNSAICSSFPGFLVSFHVLFSSHSACSLPSYLTTIPLDFIYLRQVYWGDTYT